MSSAICWIIAIGAGWHLQDGNIYPIKKAYSGVGKHMMLYLNNLLYRYVLNGGIHSFINGGLVVYCRYVKVT